ncbi:MAG: prepilin-type N-terminal cleavage/methylation domain-containing protein [Deltaproteobacteria bacterium]|nr:prepilin-type N-terminal cleavage/methylation domain-containing protein [Deltaproteobacteria bacterium]
MIKDAGFSMVELLIAVGIFVILSAVAIPSYQAYATRSRVSGAASQLFSELHTAKIKAISENNDYKIVFDLDNNRYSIYDDAVLVKTVNIESVYPGIAFGYVAGNGPDDTPITGAVTFSGSPPAVTFRPTGLVDQSGEVYLKPVEDTSRKDRQRAITVKITGTIKLYKHNGTSWE